MANKRKQLLTPEEDQHLLLAFLVPDIKGQGGNKCPTDEQAG
jgi:hypothetical protein